MIVRTTVSVFLSLVFMATAVAAPPTANPNPNLKTNLPQKLYRLLVVDVSPSMENERIAEVRTELERMLKTFPPTTDAPVEILTFATTAHPTKTFTDLPKALACVRNLSVIPDGTTNIGAALDRAANLLEKRADLSHAALMLYTDDDDGDRVAIEGAERKLSKLFRKRAEQGLSQAVMIRSWSMGGADTRLAAALDGNVDVTVFQSTSPLPVVPVTVHPAVRVTGVERTADGQAVTVRCVPSVTIGGPLPPSVAPPRFAFRCLNNGPAPLPPWTVDPRTKPTTHDATVAFSRSDLQSKKMVLRFSVEPVTGMGTTDQWLPLLQATELSVPVNLPDLEQRYEYAAKLKPTGTVRWDDPSAGLVAIDLELTLGVRRADRQSTPHPRLTFRIEVNGKGQVVSLQGPSDVAFDQGGVQKISYQAIVQLPPDAWTTGKPCQRVALKITPIRIPSTVTLGPAHRVVSSELLPLPPPTETEVTIELESVSSPIWHRWPDIGAMRIGVRVNVDGPLPPDTKLAVIAPPEVATLELVPDTIHAGEQILHFNVGARLSPAPEINELVFQFEPPADSPLIRVQCTDQLAVPVPGPVPARLVVTSGGRPVQTLTNTVLFDATSAPVSAVLQLDGPVTRHFAKSVRARLVGLSGPNNGVANNGVANNGVADNGVAGNGGLFPLYGPVFLDIPLPPIGTGSYFLDQEDSFSLAIDAFEPTPAVEGTTVHAKIIRQAEFKRHLFIGLTVLAVVISPWLFFRLARSLRLDLSTSEPDDGPDIGVPGTV